MLIAKIQGPRVNQDIRSREVRVIGPDGSQLGILSISEALSKADDCNLDLVEIAPQAVPPVCKIIDYGRYKYEQSKKQHAARAHQRIIHVKEVKVRPQTDQHDIGFKVGHIRRFIEHGDKTKVLMQFRGREMAHTQVGVDVLTKMYEEVVDIAQLEQAPRMEGNCMVMILAPKAH